MKKKVISVFKYLLFLGIGIFLIWWQIGKMTELQKVEFVDSLRNAQYIYLIPVFILALISHLSRAMRWKLMLEPMGYHPSTSNTFYATLTGYFANNFVPRAGELMRCTMLSKYEKIPFSKLFGTVIVERLFDLICYIFIILLTIVVQLKTVQEFISDKAALVMGQQSSVPLWLKLTVLACIAALAYFGIRWALKNFAHLGFILKFKRLVRGLKEGFLTIIHLKKRKTFLFHTVVIWGTYLLQVRVGFFALSETAHLGPGAALSILSLTTFAMIIAPGGIGAFPVAVQQVLLIYDVDNISFGWLMWGANTGIIILLGLISFALLHISNKNKKFMKETVPRPGDT